MERLAFTVMTQLPASATLNQVSGVTRDVCDMFVARGVITVRLGSPSHLRTAMSSPTRSTK
jgi:hypothetical protein